MSTVYLIIGLGVVLWLILLLQQWVRKPFHSQVVVLNPKCNLGHVAAVHSIQGARGHMEDAHYGDHRTGFFAVYDGHGGARCSAYAAAHLHEIIYKHTHIDSQQQLNTSTIAQQQQKKTKLQSTPTKATNNKNGDKNNNSNTNQQDNDDDLEYGEEIIVTGICEAFEELDKSWLSLATLHNYDDGTTAITLLIHNGILYVANCGDSRAVLVNSAGQAIEMSQDHKPNTAAEKSRIESLGGRIIYYGTWRVEGILAVTRSIGDRRLKRYVTSLPEIRCRRLRNDDDFIILASDGVWDVVSSQTSAEIVHYNRDSVKEAALKITNQAYKQHSMDNITTMVIDLRQYR